MIPSLERGGDGDASLTGSRTLNTWASVTRLGERAEA